MRFPRVVADLVSARGLVASRGLSKGQLEDAEGRVCANGAILVAVSGRAVPSHLIGSPKGHRILAATGAVARVTGGRDYYDIPTWNNAKGRTKADVLAAFDAAASLALSEAAARGEL